MHLQSPRASHFCSKATTLVRPTSRRWPTEQADKDPIVSRSSRRAGRLQERLLAWYDRERRKLPWRALPGEHPDPYRIWVSEIMLQQTTAAAVAPYFTRFMALWPRVEDLAAAQLDGVLHAWQGLGYYARARNMYACARVVAASGGRFPESEEELRRLPGIGAYTAAAMAAIAFDRPAVPVDGNAARVLARLQAIEQPLPAARPAIEARARVLAPAARAGDFAQALMDLGATVCTPRQPRCPACPWRDCCAAFALGSAEAYPRKAAKKDRPVRHAAAFWVMRGDGAVLLRKRPPTGLLGGMMEVPSTEWRERPWSEGEALTDAPVTAQWVRLPGGVGHIFTHFRLEIMVLAGRCAAAAVPDGAWVRPDRLGEHALPTLMKKIAAHALGSRGPFVTSGRYSS
jgi:A/G-specific adenine glycosylase